MATKSARLLTLAFSFMLVPRVIAQDSSRPKANTVSVSADGSFTVQPDTALLQFNVSVQEDKAKAAYEHASKSAEQEVLKDNGIEPKSAEVGHFSVVPIFEWKQSKRKAKAYRVIAVTKVKLKDFAKIGPIVQGLAETHFIDNESVEYIVEDLAAAKRSAVEDAYRRANESAAVIAKASGRTLGELSSAEVDSFEQVQGQSRRQDMFGELAPGLANNDLLAHKQAEYAAPTSEFSAPTIVVPAHVHAVFVLK